MRPSNPTLKFSDKEFEAETNEDMVSNSVTSKSKAAAFVMLFGTSKWRKLKSQFAEQRIQPETFGGFTKEQIGKLTAEEYDKHEEAIMQDLQLPDKKKPVFGEVSAPDLQLLGLEGQKTFIEAFGHERYFKAMNINPGLDVKSYHEALGREYKPYVTSSAEVPRKESA